jgi:hypothetical protein
LRAASARSRTTCTRRRQGTPQLTPGTGTWFAAGYTSGQIRRHGVTEGTVRKHPENIYATAATAMRFACCAVDCRDRRPGKGFDGFAESWQVTWRFVLAWR